MEFEDGCSMYGSYSSYNNTYSKQFPDEGEEDIFNPSKLSFHLSPHVSIQKRNSDSPSFLGDAWANTDNAQVTSNEEREYGFFVDLQDSFDPRLYLRQDADTNDYELPPGQEISKIIIRTHLLKIKEENLNLRCS